MRDRAGQRCLPQGELNDGTAGRGSENKVPFVAAVSLDEEGHPLRAKLSRLPGFTRKAIADWAGAALSPQSTVISDGLACFAGVTDAGCAHEPTVVGRRKPKEPPLFHWVNTVLGNVKTGLSGAYHAFAFGKYAERYFGTITYRFNRRLDQPRPAQPTAVGRSSLWSALRAGNSDG